MDAGIRDGGVNYINIQTLNISWRDKITYVGISHLSNLKVGGNGDNCGIIFLKNNKTNQVIGAHVVKIDPGFSFNYDGYYETKRKYDGDERDIQISNSGDIFIKWNKLSDEQKEEFLEVKLNTIEMNNEEILNFLLFRNGDFNKNETIKIDEKISSKLKIDLKNHLDLEYGIYEKEISNYKLNRKDILFEKGKKAYESQNYELAYRYIKRVIELKELSKNYTNVDVLYSLFGSILSDLGEYSKSLEYHQNSLEIQFKNIWK